MDTAELLMVRNFAREWAHEFPHNADYRQSGTADLVLSRPDARLPRPWKANGDVAGYGSVTEQLARHIVRLTFFHPAGIRPVWAETVHANIIHMNAFRLEEESEAQILGYCVRLCEFLDITMPSWLCALIRQAESVAAERGGAETKPVPRQRHQEDEIVRVIRELGHDPMSLPKAQPGKRGIKSEVRTKLKYSKSVFDLAWKRLAAAPPRIAYR